MKKKPILLAFIVTIAIGSSVQAQTDDEFEKFKQEYEKGLQELRDDYRKYVEQADKEFADYLKKDWEQFQLFKAMSVEEMPGPEKIPVYKQIINVEPVRKIQPKQIVNQVSTESYSMKPRQAIPIDEKRKPNIDYKAATFTFYGSMVQITVPMEVCTKFGNDVSESSIASYWKKMIQFDYNSITGQVLKIKSHMNLNDWGLWELTRQLSAQVSGDQNTQRLFQWFILTKMGYKTKVGYQNNMVYLLVPSVNQIYGYNYYSFDGLKYYLFGDNPGTLFTYANDYPEANQIMNFNLYSPPALPVDTLKRNISFTHDSKKYSFSVQYNKNLVEFYKNYPQCNIGLYFDAGVSELTKESLAKSLWPVVHSMNEKEAVAFLLKFVQTGFEYKTDQEQFGKEKYFFAEEMLYYPAADCEDRSVFFAFLVSEFMQLPVISLCYPLHVATAVNFGKNVYGDFIEYKGGNYTICDPTYINAPIGACMPEYKKSKLNVIAPEKRNPATDQPEYVWERIYKAGGARTGSSNDLIQLKDNSYVVAGFFKDSLQLGKTIYNPDKNTTGLFLATYDKGNNLVWVSTFQSNGYIAPGGITSDKNGNIYLTGQFSGTLTSDKNTLKAKSPDDQFVLKMSPSGNMDWLVQISLDTATRNKPYAFQGLLSETGEVQGFMYVQDDTWDENITIYQNDRNAIVVTAERGLGEARYTFGPEFRAAASFEFVDTWKKLTDQYISMKYNRSIAGFFALMETLENTNLDITGKEILATLNTLSPSFKTTYKGFYTNLQMLTRLSSRNGVVSFYTNNGQVLKCGPISITSGAQAQMRDYKSGNKQIKVMKGIYYDTLFRSLHVNYIKFFKVNGDLMIDYSDDHYQKVVNTEKDILRQ